MQKVKTTELNKPPLQPDDIGNLEIENDETQELTRCRKCRILCIRESITMCILILGIGGAHFYIAPFYFYSARAWVFYALGIISCLLVVWFIARICKAIQPKNKKKTEEENQEEEQEEKNPSKSAVMFDAMKTRYNHFQINGKYYLTKMYALELLEHTQQMYFLSTVYLCLMPVGASTIVCAILTAELLINIWATFHISSQEVRDRLLFLDICTDLFCLGFPPAYSWVSYGIPVEITQLIWLVTYPTLSAYLKLIDIWDDDDMMMMKIS